VSLAYAAIFFKGQPEGAILLDTDDSNQAPYSDSMESDEAIARALQAQDPNWRV
jgi:hypothetical protein